MRSSNLIKIAVRTNSRVFDLSNELQNSRLIVLTHWLCVTSCTAHTSPRQAVGHSPAFTTVWPLLNSYCVVEQTVNGQIEQNILLSWKAFRVANTKGIETKQRQSFHCTLHWSDHVTWTHCISMRKTKPFLGKISTSLCRSVNNSRPQTSESHRTINIEIQRADLLIQIIDLAKVTESHQWFALKDSPVVRSWLSCPYNVQVLQQRLGEGGRPLPAESVAWCPHWCPSAPEHTTNTDTKSKAL